jgi:hypothetical protein
VWQNRKAAKLSSSGGISQSFQQDIESAIQISVQGVTTFWTFEFFRTTQFSMDMPTL